MFRSAWFLAVFACSSPRREPAPAVASESPPAPSPVDATMLDAMMMPAVLPDADPFAGYPDRLARPASTCVLRGAWKEQPEALRLTAGGKPYASVFGVTHAEVTLAAKDAFAEVTTGSIAIAGFVDPKRLHVHAANAFTVGDFAVPGAKLPMRFVAEHDNKLAFELPLPSVVKGKRALRGERPCSELGIDDTAEVDPRDAVDADGEAIAYLHEKRAIPLSIAFGKPAVVTLRYDESPKVRILEKREKSARVEIEINSLDPAEHVMLFGWVPQSSLHQDAHGFGGSWATGGGGAARPGPPRKDTKFVRCPLGVALAVEFEGQRKTVGMIAPSIVLEVLPGGDDFAAIRFPKPHAELADGARWLVKQAALAGCAAATP